MISHPRRLRIEPRTNFVGGKVSAEGALHNLYCDEELGFRLQVIGLNPC
jgi:hypothetical protein